MASASKRELFAIAYHNHGSNSGHPIDHHEANGDRCDRQKTAPQLPKVTVPQGDPGGDQQTHDKGCKRQKKERRGSNRLGFAMQLCTLRYPGRTLGLSETPPKEMPRLRRGSARRRPGPCSASTRSGRRRAGSTRLNSSSISAFGRSGWLTGAPASGSARTRHGRRTAASRLSLPFSAICARPTCSFRERRFSSGSGWLLAPAPVALPFMCWRTASPTPIRRICLACSRSMPVSVDRGLRGFAIALNRRHPPTW